MISELYFIKGYNNFWNTLFPGLDDYIRLINGVLCEDVFKPIRSNDNAHRRGLVNNIAYELFYRHINKTLTDIDINHIDFEGGPIISLVKDEILKLSNLRFGNDLGSTLDYIERDLIKEIIKRLTITYSNTENLVVAPSFDGCGILFPTEGDLLNGNTLVEIKGGVRNFKSIDLRQLYTYAALNHMSEKYAIKSFELFNPRIGRSWKEDVDIVSKNLSGISTIEVLTEIVWFISKDFGYS